MSLSGQTIEQTLSNRILILHLLATGDVTTRRTILLHSTISDGNVYPVTVRGAVGALLDALEMFRLLTGREHSLAYCDHEGHDDYEGLRNDGWG